MGSTEMFLIGTGITMAASLIVIWYMKKPLTSLLSDLCGTHEKASFWTTFTSIMLVLTPLFITLCRTPDNKPDTNAFMEIMAQFKFGVFALLVAVFVMGMILVSFTPKRE
ncbi:MAG: hypothetical protein OEV59_08830 [Deltaproteobacteria bacterium]|nr:hypothetical protein [Deltaproteobacteria bacterium]